MLAACLSVFGGALRARAQEPLETNDYNIDLFTSPVLGPGRIVGMGGAHVAIASAIDGAAYNPAGYAERLEKEIRFAAFDITGGIWFGGLFRNYDFENNGKRGGLKSADTIQATLGMRVQIAQFGIGATALGRVYTLKDGKGRAVSDLALLTVRMGAGYAFLDGGLVIGGGLVLTGLNVSKAGSALNDFGGLGFRGFGVEVGALVRPKYKRWRLGSVFRSAIEALPRDKNAVVDEDGVRRQQGLVLPASAHVPWEFALGFAYQFGERRANVPWRNTRELRSELARQIASGSYRPPPTYGEAPYPVLPHDVEKATDAALEHYREGERRLRRHQPRRYVLLAADVLIYGKTEQGQSMSGFLRQMSEPSGQRLAIGVRVGAESEVWQDRMKVRLGTYLEPSRTSPKLYRPHGTLGLEARLFDFWYWSARATATIDVAPRYFNWGLAFGLWW
ncbi:MAG TPA: hypothetical protein VFZ61_00450 [Polyangiales bacterium]